MVFDKVTNKFDPLPYDEANSFTEGVTYYTYNTSSNKYIAASP
jgi:hypothetical protein